MLCSSLNHYNNLNYNSGFNTAKTMFPDGSFT